MKNKTFYITTPIYYPSGKWHLGHSYTTVICDAVARYKKMQGYDVFYLTGTDEHGQKIEEKALAAGVSPKEFTDKLVGEIKELWKLLDIDYDKFIRTTDDYHEQAIQRIFKALYDKGDIYKSEYEGMYCTPCESFWTKSQLKDGKCPDCNRDVKEAKEESYFFRLSKYQEPIRKLLTETDFLEPSSRVNEMVKNFIEPGLNDLAVSRTSFKWGIPVPFDSKHVVYVWIDALSNYITALGAFGQDDSLMKKYWPADLQVVGKEIVRFHSIIWPALLMALDLPLPKKLFGHGWLLFGGDKMSKSKGNTADPFVLCGRYGLDAVRYYLLREVPFGSDGIYTDENFLKRINSDLANDYGNLVSRTTAMAVQYFGGKVTRPVKFSGQEADLALSAKREELAAKVDGLMNELKINKAMEEIFALIGRANKYIDETTPWTLAKTGQKERLNEVLYNLLESVRVANILLAPFLTRTPPKVFEYLGLKGRDISYKSAAKLNAVAEYTVTKAEAVFPRIDIEKELKELESAAADKAAKAAPVAEKTEKKMITIDEFFNTELKTALVTACEKVEKSDKLLKLTVSLGNETRTVVSGIAKYYTPEEMVGKTVVLVANLAPAKLRGIESQGMILCASDAEGRIIVVSPEKAVEPGSEVR